MPKLLFSSEHSKRLVLTAAFAVSLTLLSACVATLPKLPIAVANFGATSVDVEGVWSGSYVCAQGLTGVRLHLKANGPQTVVGRYDFFSLPGQSNSAAGSFAVMGTVSMGRVDLKPGQWIVRPQNYQALNVSASIFADPDRLFGAVNQSGCGRFEVARSSKQTGEVQLTVASPADVRAALPAAAAPMPTSSQRRAPEFTGSWQGTLNCGSGPLRLELVVSPVMPAGAVQAIGSISRANNKNIVPMLTMLGKTAGDQIQLRWDKALSNPDRFPEIDIEGNWQGDTERIAARVVNNSKCKPFELQRRTMNNMRAHSLTAAPSKAASPAAAAAPSSGPKPVTHAEFVKRLGNQKLPSFVGTALQLNLKSGGDGGWDGFIEDPQSMVFFRCPPASTFIGGPLVAKIAKIKDNDNGVFVDLDRCNP